MSAADRKEKKAERTKLAEEKAAKKAAESARAERLNSWLEEKGWNLKNGKGGAITQKSLAPFLKEGTEDLEWAKGIVGAKPAPPARAEEEAEAPKRKKVRRAARSRPSSARRGKKAPSRGSEGMDEDPAPCASPLPASRAGRVRKPNSRFGS